MLQSLLYLSFFYPNNTYFAGDMNTFSIFIRISVCRNHNAVLVPFMTCGRVCSKSKTRHVPRVEQEQLIPVRITWFHIRFWWRSFCSILNLRVVFCRSLFVLLCFFFWPLRSLSFFGLRFLITHLLSSSFSLIWSQNRSH